MNVMEIILIVDETSHTKPQVSTGWHTGDGEKVRITKVIRVYPLETMNVSTKLRAKLRCTFWPAGGATWKSRHHPRDQTFLAIHPILVEMIQSGPKWRSNQLISIQRVLTLVWLKQIVPHEIINNGRHSGSDGVECTPHVLRLRPDCSSPGFRSDLWPFAACRLSQPVSCHISSCPICHEKAKTNRFITLNSMETRLSDWDTLYAKVGF